MSKAVHFDAQGADWALRFDFNALCRLEEAFGKPMAEIAKDLGAGGGLQQMRSVFHIGLRPPADVEKAGDIMEDLGIERAAQLIEQAFLKAFPEAAAATGAAGKRKGAAG